MIASKRFDPMSCLDSLNCPTLIIGAEEESLFDRENYINGVKVKYQS